MGMGDEMEYLKHGAQLILENLWWMVAAMAGRLMFHGHEAQAGRRRFWGRELPFEIVVASGMGLIGYSACAWLDLPGPVSAGVIGAIGYLGPRAIDTLFERIVERIGKAAEEKTK